jgi:hypothetical protein
MADHADIDSFTAQQANEDRGHDRNDEGGRHSGIGFSSIDAIELDPAREFWRGRSRLREEKTAYASQRKLHAHGDDDQSHEPRCRVAPEAAGRASSSAGHEHHDDLPKDVQLKPVCTGRRGGVWPVWEQ